MNNEILLTQNKIWEEKDLTEQSKKLENKETSEPSGGINETKNESVEIVCEDTGKKRIWIRKCRENICIEY